MVRFNSDTGPVKPVSGVWQKAQASLRFTENLVVQHRLAEQFDLLGLIVRRRGQPLGGLRLDAVDLGLDLRYFLLRLGREICAGLLRARRIRAQRGEDQGRRRSTKACGCVFILNPSRAGDDHLDDALATVQRQKTLGEGCAMRQRGGERGRTR